MATATKNLRTIFARGTAVAAFTQLTGASVTRSTTTATLTKTTHGLSVSDKVLVRGFELEEFNGVFNVASVPLSSTITYTISQDPGANPGGTPGTVDKGVLGTAVDLSTALGGVIVGHIQNHNTTPTNATEIWLGVSGNAGAEDWFWRQLAVGNTDNNGVVHFRHKVEAGVMRVNLFAVSGAAQIVDVAAVLHELTSVA